MLENFYYLLFVFTILGLILGSFYNVLILRILKNESIISPPSSCPKCGERLLWWHNIPVLSYIILKGKCYFCKKEIDIQYPIMEIVSAGIFASCFIKYGATILCLKQILILSILLMLSVFDLKEKQIPPRFVLVLGFAIVFCGCNILNMVLMGLGLSLLKYVLDKTYDKQTIGEGDIAVITLLAGNIFNIPMFLAIILLTEFLFVLPYIYKSVLKSGMWFLISYALLLLDKFCIIPIPQIAIWGLYLSLVGSIYFLIKNLKLPDIKQAVLPAIFVSSFVCMIMG